MNPLIENPIVVQLGWTLLHFLWQGAAVAAVFGIVNLFLKGASPQRRYVIAYASLVGLAACPLVTFALLHRSPPVVTASPMLEPPGAADPGQPFAKFAPNAPPLNVEAASGFRIPDGSPMQEARFLEEPAKRPSHWPSILVATWLLGVLTLSLRHAAGWLRLHRLRRAATLIEDPGILRVFAELKSRLRLSKTVEILESTRLLIPATIGFLKPVILVPASTLAGLERWQLEAIIAHELAHVRRWDFAANLLQCAIESLLFYHPAIWWISHVVRREREFCADDIALAVCGDRKGYAVALTRLAELAAPMELAVAANGGDLLQRVRRIVGKPQSQRSGFASLLAALVVSGVIAASLLGSRVLAQDSKVIEVQAGESIQAAIDAASEGATIRLAAGEFRDRIRISKPLTVEGAGWDKTRVLLPPEEAQKRKEFEDKIQSAKTADEREMLIEVSRSQLDGPILSVADARGVALRGLRIAAGEKDNNRQLPPLAEFRNAEVRATGCAFTGPAQNGIHIGDKADVEMSECLVAGLWGEGIVISGARGADPRVVIRDSEVRNIYHYGIQIGRGCDRVTIQRCRISGTAWHGIRYDSASPLIEGNTIYDHARSGIYASGRTRATIRGNLFYGNEMSGVSCWFDNQDLIEGNTFAANEREGLGVLGASKPKVRANVFWANPVAIIHSRVANDSSNAKGAAVLEGNVFWKNDKNLPSGEETQTDELPAESKSLIADPGFANADIRDFSLRPDSPARKHGAGVSAPLSFTSPWALLAEEKQLIPDGSSRDSNAWKKADGSVRAPVNRYQRQQLLYRSVESIVKDALQIDDVEKRDAAVEKIRVRITSQINEEAAAGLVAYQGIGPVKFDKKSFREPLLAKLGSEDSFVRTQAVIALSGGAGERGDIERLAKLANDPDPDVRGAVANAIVWLSGKDLTGPEGATWMAMFEAGNASLKQSMVRLLWGAKTTMAMQERLVTLSREPGELAYDCLYYALSTSPNKGEACVNRLIEYLANADTVNIGGRAAWGLSYGVEPPLQGKVTEAMLKVVQAREVSNMRTEAFNCLGSYARQSDLPALEAILAKPGLSDYDKKKLEEIVTSAKGRKAN